MVKLKPLAVFLPLAIIVTVSLSILSYNSIGSFFTGYSIDDLSIEEPQEILQSSISEEKDDSLTIQFSGGDGSLENPYQITNCTELQDMNYYLYASYILMNDINCTDGFTPIGSGYDPFIGTFEGQNYTITGLYAHGQDYIRFFGYSRGVIGNVALDGLTVSVRYYVGVLVGQNDAGTIINSWASGYVSGDSSVGGLVGASLEGNIMDSYFNGNVSGSSIGGLVGDNWGTIINSYAKGDVSGASCGGLAAFNRVDGIINNSYFIGNVSGTGIVGGLVAFNGWGDSKGTIINSYTSGTVSGINDTVGGLVADSAGGTIYSCYSNASVSGRDSVGGLIGSTSFDETIINKSYATGDVSGRDYVGGLSGTFTGTLENSYATGNVSGRDGVGGLVGASLSNIVNCYAVGNVSGIWRIGGLIGINYGIINNSYWDMNTSGLNESEGGTGKTTEEMKHQATFVGWDFTNIWGINESLSYPFFIDAPSEVCAAPAMDVTGTWDGYWNSSVYPGLADGMFTINWTQQNSTLNGTGYIYDANNNSGLFPLSGMLCGGNLTWGVAGDANILFNGTAGSSSYFLGDYIANDDHGTWQATKQSVVVDPTPSSSSGGGGGGGCSKQWTCSDWNSCYGGKQYRECSCACSKDSECRGDNSTERACFCEENWQCSEWSQCFDNVSTRTCVDSGNCGTYNNKPLESQSCVMPVEVVPAPPESNTWLYVLISSLILATVIASYFGKREILQRRLMIDIKGMENALASGDLVSAREQYKKIQKNYTKTSQKFKVKNHDKIVSLYQKALGF